MYNISMGHPIHKGPSNSFKATQAAAQITILPRKISIATAINIDNLWQQSTAK